MTLKEELKSVLVVGLLLMVLGLIFLQTRRSPIDLHYSKCECNSNNMAGSPQQKNSMSRIPTQLIGDADVAQNIHSIEKLTSKTSSSRSTVQKYLSYQPPGNGWNNQRIALENALVLARLLNRTLLVHPLAPHELGSKLKVGQPHGYMVYNLLNESDLLPLSMFMDLELMAQVTPVVEVTSSHRQFIADYSYLTWKNICHTPGYGYWVDKLPQKENEVELLSKQKFVSLGNIWKEKCPEEKERVELNHIHSGIAKYVSDLADDPAEMLYFEHGTLFGMQIRFTTYEGAVEAQRWVVDNVRYNENIWNTIAKVASKLRLGRGVYNAIQVRRKMHMDSRLSQSFWIERMIDKNFSKDLPVYVATNGIANSEWFSPFKDEGYNLQFSINFQDFFNFSSMRESLRNDFLAIHEQCLCEQAQEFVPSPASTFTAFILRHRPGEVELRDGLMMDTLHTYWTAHQTH